MTLKPEDWVAPTPTHPSYVPEDESEITLQLTADQQVNLSVSGTDKYGNPVEIGGSSVWQSSDESIVVVRSDKSASPSQAVAQAVGPEGTAAVTFTNDANRDGSGDFMGSLAIDVVAGQMAEIVITAGEPEDKREINDEDDTRTQQVQGQQGKTAGQQPQSPQQQGQQPPPQGRGR